MTEISSSEEYKECRDRVNPKKDDTLLYSKTGVCDDYQATDAKCRKNELDFNKELSRLTGEVWDEL